MTSPSHARPAPTEYAPYFGRYVAHVPEVDIVATLRADTPELISALKAIPEERGGFRYAEGKWSIRETIGHMIDAERIFSYRALRLARGDATPLPGFEQNDYAAAAGSDARTLKDLTEELRLVRESTILLFASLPEEAWTRRAVVSGNEISVRALAYVIAGHGRHHLKVLRDSYLVR
jgi:uncharacterized damage-inducible protein DinB